MLLLLDTHVWIWVVEGDSRRVGRRTRQLLTRGETQDALRISPFTVFEVTALHTAGRLGLTRPVDDWIREAVEGGGVRMTPVSSAVALDAGRIRRAVLADPLDRLLAATARQSGATFVTADARILDYAARTGHLRAHDASQ